MLTFELFVYRNKIPKSGKVNDVLSKTDHMLVRIQKPVFKQLSRLPYWWIPTKPKSIQCSQMYSKIGFTFIEECQGFNHFVERKVWYRFWWNANTNKFHQSHLFKNQMSKSCLTKWPFMPEYNIKNSNNMSCLSSGFRSSYKLNPLLDVCDLV